LQRSKLRNNEGTVERIELKLYVNMREVVDLIDLAEGKSNNDDDLP